MKMAKASTADMEMAMKLCTALEWLERGDMPTDARAPDEEGSEEFDSEDVEHCYRAMKEVLRIVRRGSIGRVVFGMYVLLDPANKLVDPDADTLERHPDDIAADKDAERYRSALERIERWNGEFPDTGRYWDEPENARPMSYIACYGSNGERDYMRAVARQALEKPVTLIPKDDGNV